MVGRIYDKRAWPPIALALAILGGCALWLPQAVSAPPYLLLGIHLGLALPTALAGAALAAYHALKSGEAHWLGLGWGLLGWGGANLLDGFWRLWDIETAQALHVLGLIIAGGGCLAGRLTTRPLPRRIPWVVAGYTLAVLVLAALALAAATPPIQATKSLRWLLGPLASLLFIAAAGWPYRPRSSVAPNLWHTLGLLMLALGTLPYSLWTHLFRVAEWLGGVYLLVAGLDALFQARDPSPHIQALRHSEQLARQRLMEIENIYRTAPVGLCVLDRDLRWTRINERLAAINGYSVAEHLGTRVAERLPGLAAQIEPALRHILATGEAMTNIEVTDRPIPGGPPRIWRASWLPIQDENGTVVAINIVSEDISEQRQAEASLLASEERLQLGIQVAGLGLADIDYAQDLNRLSAEAARLFGLGDTALTVPRAVVHATAHPEDRPVLMVRIAAALDPQGAGWFALDHRVIWPDGEIRWLRIRKQVFFASEGADRKPTRAILAALDVTAEKTAIETVRQSEAFVRGVLDSLPQQVAVLDNTGRVRMVNEPWERFTRENGGDSQVAIVGENYLTICQAAADQGDDHATAALTGLRAVLAGEREYYQLEYPCHAPDRERWFLMHARQRLGTLSGLILSHVDITERKQAEKRLRDNEYRLRQALRLGRSFAFEWRPETDEVLRSEDCADILGLSGEQAIHDTGQYFFQRVHPEDRAGFIATVGSLSPQQSTYVCEYRLIRPDNQSVVLHETAQALFDDEGRIQRLFGITADITERKHMETLVQARTAELEHLNRELEAFAYSVSHDLRTPLRAIHGFVRILVEDHGPHLDPEARRLLDVVTANAQRMGQLIDDLLAFSRMGRKEMAHARIDMRPLVQQVLAELRPGFESRRVDIDLAPLPSALGDAAMLRQVWINLIGNALKFTQHRDPARIAIGGRYQAGEAIYTVKDNGAGFDMAYAERLFGVFERLHGADEFEGTGIGLALVKRIITRHGGRVWAEAQEDVGAEFSFALPAEPPRPEAPAIGKENAPG